METAHWESDILQQATAKLQELTGYMVTYSTRLNKTANSKHTDCYIEIQRNDFHWSFTGEVKKTLTRLVLERITTKHHAAKTILVSKQLSKEQASVLKHEGVQYIDTIGNIYIDEPPLFIYITGLRKIERQDRPKQLRTFNKTGLKVLFTLLANNDLEKRPYKEIAYLSDSANGSVQWVMGDLIQEGNLIIDHDGNRRFIDHKILLDKWIEAYPIKLKEKLLIGRYRSDIENWWMDIDIKQYNAQWSDEVAAFHLTDNLFPQIKTLYASGNINSLLVKGKLKKDNNGDVQIYKKFWRFDTTDIDANFVPPILIYADLLASMDSRNLEAARIIYDRYLFSKWK